MPKILLVGIQPERCPVVRHLLTDTSHELLIADSYAAAVKFLAYPTIELVLSEVHFKQDHEGYDGLDLCRSLRGRRSTALVPFLLWSPDLDLEVRIRGYNLGADDCLDSSLNPLELGVIIDLHLKKRQKVQKTIQGFSFQVLPPVASIQQSWKTAPAISELPLTPAEQKVFKEVAQGLTNHDIGEHLGISPRTVQTHITNMLRKLQLENRAQIVRLAFEGGYVSAARAASSPLGLDLD